ncbi:MAG: xylan 1,4-beta-xylosidase [Lawsonibacter sp.]|nr:xylan 1,4-beta-xylosidase [Lawsonibacter sp.]MCI8870330.1 xylan 1,4-beta-xylosidase [Lawsonibacter sp.]
MIGGRTFQRIFKEGVVDVTEIWVDTQTGVHYLFHASGNAGGLTPLLGPDGKPIVQQGAAEE